MTVYNQNQGAYLKDIAAFEWTEILADDQGYNDENDKYDQYMDGFTRKKKIMLLLKREGSKLLLSQKSIWQNE